MKEAEGSKKRKLNVLYTLKHLKKKRDYSIYKELVSGVKAQDVMDKYQVSRERLYVIKKKLAIQEIKKQERLETIAYRLDLTVAQIRRYRNDYIYQVLSKEGRVAILAAELRMTDKQILEIRDNKIISEMLRGTTIQEIAKKSHVTHKTVVAIRDKHIIDLWKEKHPEEIASDFGLSLEQVFLIKEGGIESNRKTTASTIHIKNILQQLEQRKKEVLTLLEEGKPTKAVAQELKISQRSVIDIRNRAIEQAFEKKQTGATISQQFHMEIEDVYRLRDVRLLTQSEQGKSSNALSKKFNLSVSRIGSILSRNNSSSKLDPTKIRYHQIPKISEVSDDMRKRILNRIRETKITKALGNELNVLVPLIYRVRNHEILKKLNDGESTQAIADEFKMNTKTINEVVFRANLAEFPNIKRRTLAYLTPEQAKTVREYIHRQLTNKQISEALDIKESLIKCVRRKMEFQKEKFKMRRRITKEQKEQIMKEIKKIHPFAHSSKTGVSESTIRLLTSRFEEKKDREIQERQKGEKIKTLQNLDAQLAIVKQEARIKNIQQIIQKQKMAKMKRIAQRE